MINPNFSVPNAQPSLPTKLAKFEAAGGSVTFDNRTQEFKADRTQSSWVAFLKVEFENQLVVDISHMQLWLDKSTEDKAVFESLPSHAQLIHKAQAEYNLVEPNSTTSNLQSAIDYLIQAPITDTNLREVNPYEERIKRYANTWDGQDRFSEVFSKTLGSTQDPDVLATMATSYFRGLVFNLVRPESMAAAIYPISLDILSTKQGNGKTYFANMLKGVIEGAGRPVASGVAIDLKNPANAYPIVVNGGLLNDDELGTTNASKLKGGASASGADVNSQLKTVLSSGTLTWIPKFKNDPTTHTNRSIWIRTTNSTKVYGSSVSEEVERRFMTVEATANHEKMDSANMYKYMQQLLGQAYQSLQDKPFDEQVDTLMPESIRDAMRDIQYNGSNRAELYALIDEMMDHEMAAYGFNNTTDAVQVLRGSRDFRISGQRPAEIAGEQKFISATAIVTAAINEGKNRSIFQNKSQVEAMVETWLIDNGFVKSEKTSIKVKGYRFHSNNLWENPNYIETPKDKLPAIDPMTGIDYSNVLPEDEIKTESETAPSFDGVAFQGLVDTIDVASDTNNALINASVANTNDSAVDQLADKMSQMSKADIIDNAQLMVDALQKMLETQKVAQ